MPATPDLQPLFPLPNVVLFLKGILPLHVFEPRYRTMMADALKGGQTICMALLKPGWEADYHGSPEVYRVASVGRSVVNTVAMNVNVEPRVKQELLELDSLGARCRAIVRYLRDSAATQDLLDRVRHLYPVDRRRN